MTHARALGGKEAWTPEAIAKVCKGYEQTLRTVQSLFFKAEYKTTIVMTHEKAKGS